MKTRILSALSALVSLVSFAATPPTPGGNVGVAIDPSNNVAFLNVTAGGALITQAGGDVVGPSSSTDNAVARFDGTTGKLLQNSAVTIGDAGNAVFSIGGNTTATPDLLINPTTKASGNLIDAQVNSVSKFKVDYAGSLTAGSGTFSGSIFVGGNNDLISGSANSGFLDFGCNSGVRIRNKDNNAYAAITAGAITASGIITVPGLTNPVITTSSAITSGAGASVGTLTNAPAVGNPTKWIPINDNGTTRYIPAW